MVRFSLLANALPKADSNATTDQKVSELMDYQVQLLEYLRYALSNLEEDNFSETGLKHILEPVLVEVGNVEGKVASVAVTADQIKLEVTNKLADVADKNGMVTAASIAVKLAEDESLIAMIADKVAITGTVSITSKNNGVGDAYREVEIKDGAIGLLSGTGDNGSTNYLQAFSDRLVMASTKGIAIKSTNDKSEILIENDGKISIYADYQVRLNVNGTNWTFRQDSLLMGDDVVFP